MHKDGISNKDAITSGSKLSSAKTLGGSVEGEGMGALESGAPPLFSGPPAESGLSTPAEGRRERHRRETFERLVRAAREILFNRGFDDVTVQDITEAADVGKGTFFNYFRSKEHVVSRLLEYNRNNLARLVESVRTGQRSVHDAITAMMRAYLLPEDGDWLTYEDNIMHALTNDEVRVVFSEQLKANLPLWESLIGLGQEQGSIRRDLPAADLARLTTTYVSGFTVLLWIHDTPPTLPLVDKTMAHLYTVLAPNASPAKRPTVVRGRAKPARSRRAPRRSRGKAR
jgi:AcrR family transcriptional regulator